MQTQAPTTRKVEGDSVCVTDNHTISTSLYVHIALLFVHLSNLSRFISTRNCNKFAPMFPFIDMKHCLLNASPVEYPALLITAIIEIISNLPA